MARYSERLSAEAFTRASVEDYLQAAAEQRARIELAIAEAEQRRDRAVEVREWLDRLASPPAPRGIRGRPRTPSKGRDRVAETDRLDAAGPADTPDVLPGDLVRDIVTRNEEEIESLLARLADVEARAEEAERAVRTHAGLALVAPDVAAGLVPEPPPRKVDPDRPRTIVVQRAAPAPARRERQRTATRPAPPAERSTGFVGRLTTSHWWWRIGIVLVLVAVVLLKFG